MKHVPGVRVADLKMLLDTDADIVVIGLGYEPRVQITREATTWLCRHKFKAVHGSTPDVIPIYNDAVRNGEKVIGMLHCTC